LFAAIVGLPALGGYATAVAFARRGRTSAARACVLGGASVTAIVFPLASGWHGGSDRGRLMVSVVEAALLTAAVVASLPRHGPGIRQSSWSEQERAVAMVLLLVPLAQAAGTNVPLPYVAFECLALWVAVVLMVSSRREPSAVREVALRTNLVVLVASAALIAGTTTLMTPFKTTGFRSDSVPVSGLGGVRVDPTSARRYRSLEHALGPYVTRGVTPVFALNRAAGLTYLLGGVPLGSTWTDAVSQPRTAAILDLDCARGHVDPDTPPVLLLDRQPDPLVVSALNRCGVDYPEGFRRLAVPHGPPGLRVYVARGVRTPAQAAG
jgi:hypothetical protein